MEDTQKKLEQLHEALKQMPVNEIYYFLGFAQGLKVRRLDDQSA